MSSVSPLSSASQVSLSDCVSLAPPVAPGFIARDGPLTGLELELARMYYATLQRYYDACCASKDTASCPPAPPAVVASDVSSSSRGSRRSRVRSKRKRAAVAPVPVSGFCYEALFSPNAMADAVRELGSWPTLGQLMSLPLDLFLSTGELSAIMCTVDGGVVHVVNGSHGCSVKQVVQQAAVSYRTAIGTLGAAWPPFDSGLVVDRGCRIGGRPEELEKTVGPPSYESVVTRGWSINPSAGMPASLVLRAQSVVDAPMPAEGPYLQSYVRGYRICGDVALFFCSVACREAGEFRVERNVGCPVIAAYSRCRDGAGVNRYDCAGAYRVRLNVGCHDPTVSSVFVYVVRSVDAAYAVGHAARQGCNVQKRDGWVFEPAEADLYSAQHAAASSLVGLYTRGDVAGWSIVDLRKGNVSSYKIFTGRFTVLGLAAGGCFVGLLPVECGDVSGKGITERIARYAICPHGQGVSHCNNHYGFRAIYSTRLAFLDVRDYHAVRIWSLLEMIRGLKAALKMADYRLNTVADCLEVGRLVH